MIGNIRRGFAIACLLAIAATATGLSGLASRAEAQALRVVPLTIRSGADVHRFKVELAATPAQQERGLMYRTSLPRDGGMLFPFPGPRIATFWMKNTLIPLDLIFVRQDGTIARIAANATPHSLALIDSGEPVVAVLEIEGGGAARAGIKPGDKVSWGRAEGDTP